jgi:hypothetical protein
MPVSLYEISIPVFIRGLTNLAAILQKAETYADEKGLPHSTFLDARLREDMAALPFQIQRCSDTSKGVVARVGGLDNVEMKDDETTFEQLRARIHKTIELLERVDPKSMDGKEEALVVGPRGVQFTGKSFLLLYAIPNFFFHLTTAYGILVSSNSLFLTPRRSKLVLTSSAEAYGSANWQARLHWPIKVMEGTS